MVFEPGAHSSMMLPTHGIIPLSVRHIVKVTFRTCANTLNTNLIPGFRPIEDIVFVMVMTPVGCMAADVKGSSLIGASLVVMTRVLTSTRATMASVSSNMVYALVCNNLDMVLLTHGIASIP